MDNEKVYEEIKRLNFEDLLWLIFVFLSLLNIYGDYDDKKYLLTNDVKYKKESNKVFTFTLIVAFFIYLYFFARNYNAYKKASPEQKNLYLIKLLGSAFFIAGAICLLYFQINQNSFVGSPAL